MLSSTGQFCQTQEDPDGDCKNLGSHSQAAHASFHDVATIDKQDLAVNACILSNDLF